MKKDNPLISVIIVNYNGLKFLPRLLQSIYKQTLKDYEIILVDNASKDNSVEYLKKEHPRVKLIEYKNNGYGSSCNKGARAGKGRFVVFLNEDMYLPEDFLEKMSKKYDEIKKKSVNIGGLSCGMLGFDRDPNVELVSTGADKTDIFGFTYPSFRSEGGEAFMLPGSPFFTERETYYNLGGFSEYILLYGEDSDLSWRANLYGYKLYDDVEVYLHHYGSAVFGTYSIKWNALTVISEFIPIINNYSLPLMLLILPIYMIYSFVLLFMLFVKLGFKFGILKEYFKRVIYIIKNFKGIWSFRQEVQRKRVISDWDILKNMSLIPAFIRRKSWNRVKS